MRYQGLIAGFFLALLSVSQGLWAQETIFLGPAPQLEPGEEPMRIRHPYTPAVKAVGFDPMVRSEVANAYINIYLPQGNVAPGWTGSIASCLPGTTTQAYRQATIDRVNYYRAHVGLPGTVALFGGSQASGTQAAALIFSAQQDIDHYPPSHWACWTQAGYDAAGKSNIAYSWGSNAGAGTGAIDLYMDDPGAGNHVVGHRRWILYPPQIWMDSGSIPWKGVRYATNAQWILGPFSGSRPAVPGGVTWPSRGYVPWQILPSSSNRWSFSWDGANFNAATISMKRDGVALGAPTKESIQNGYGDNTLVWRPQGVDYTKPGTDVTYTVTISGMSGGGVPASISYDVIVIDPYTSGEVENEAPSIDAPGSILVTEDVASSLAGISFDDPDAGNGHLTATFKVPAGSLSTVAGAGVTVGGSPTSRTLTGTLAALNGFMTGGKLLYTTAPNANGSVEMGVKINDNGHTGSDGAKQDTKDITLNIIAVNDPPRITRAPDWLPVFVSGASPVTGLSFTDVDAAKGSELTVTLKAPPGIKISDQFGSVTRGGPDTERTYTGTLGNLNLYFGLGRAGLNDDGFVEPGALKVTLNDNGHSGDEAPPEPKTHEVMIQLRAGFLFVNGFE